MRAVSAGTGAACGSPALRRVMLVAGAERRRPRGIREAAEGKKSERSELRMLLLIVFLHLLNQYNDLRRKL